MRTFVEKPRTVKAVQIATGDQPEAIKDMIAAGQVVDRGDGSFLVFHQVGATTAYAGWWIVVHGEGHLWPLEPDDFRRAFQEVAD